MTDDDEIIFTLALTQIPLLGAVKAKALLSAFGDAKSIWKAPKHALLKVPEIGERVAENIKKFKDFTRAEQELIYIRREEIALYHYKSASYPYRLREIPDAPVYIFSKGLMEAHATRVVSVVGTRKATAAGKLWTEQLIEELTEAGVVVVSGLAHGIDTYAHKAALKSGLKTWAVMASGFNYIYPVQNRMLVRQILDAGGCAVTEYLHDMMPERGNFPARNRLVAGLCDAVVVVETGVSGGSMITANMAFQYNRDVYAVPGRTSDSHHAGCHQLIKTHKAALIESAGDLLQQMNWDAATPTSTEKQMSLFPELGAEERRILQFLKERQRAGVDDICFELHIPHQKAGILLLQLEMSGLVQSFPGKVYGV